MHEEDNEDCGARRIIMRIVEQKDNYENCEARRIIMRIVEQAG